MISHVIFKVMLQDSVFCPHTCISITHRFFHPKLAIGRWVGGYETAKGVWYFNKFSLPAWLGDILVHKVHYTCHGGYKTVANIFEIVFLHVDGNIVRFHVGYITARYSVTAPPNATNWSSQASQAPHGPAATSCCWIKARAIITRRCLVDSCFMGAVVAVAQYQGVL